MPGASDALDRSIALDRQRKRVGSAIQHARGVTEVGLVVVCSVLVGLAAEELDQRRIEGRQPRPRDPFDDGAVVERARTPALERQLVLDDRAKREALLGPGNEDENALEGVLIEA